MCVCRAGCLFPFLVGGESVHTNSTSAWEVHTNKLLHEDRSRTTDSGKNSTRTPTQVIIERWRWGDNRSPSPTTPLSNLKNSNIVIHSRKLPKMLLHTAGSIQRKRSIIASKWTKTSGESIAANLMDAFVYLCVMNELCLWEYILISLTKRAIFLCASAGKSQLVPLPGTSICKLMRQTRHERVTKH